MSDYNMTMLEKELKRGHRLENTLFAIKRKTFLCRITAPHVTAENQSVETNQEKNG